MQTVTWKELKLYSLQNYMIDAFYFRYVQYYPFFLMEITLSLNLGKYPESYINYLNIEMETKSSFTCVFIAAGVSSNHT